MPEIYFDWGTDYAVANHHFIPTKQLKRPQNLHQRTERGSAKRIRYPFIWSLKMRDFLASFPTEHSHLFFRSFTCNFFCLLHRHCKSETVRTRNVAKKQKSSHRQNSFAHESRDRKWLATAVFCVHRVDYAMFLLS